MKNIKQLTLVSALIAAASLGAQEGVGSVNGTVRDNSGVPVANANVRISGPNLLQPREATTDANGRYNFRLILPGQVRVTVSKQGLIGSTQTFTVLAASTQIVDFVMRPVGVVTEEVEVLGGIVNPIIDKTDTKVTSTFSSNDLFNLPMGGSAMYGALFLSPGVSGNAYWERIRGGTGGQTMYSINGVQMRDAEVGQGRQYEGLLDDMVQDVQVVQNPINAKYGFTSSGSVNVTTKTGTNRFEGSFRATASDFSNSIVNAGWNSINGIGSATRWGSELEFNRNTDGAWGYDKPTVPADNLRPRYAVVISGPIWKDRITFIYGGRFRPQGYTDVTYTNVLGSSDPLEWHTYIPGFKYGDPKMQGPHPVTGVPANQWAGPIFGADINNPTVAPRGKLTNTYVFNQYKLFFQITPDHQLDILYTDEWYLSNTYVATPDQSVLFPNEFKRPMKSVNYRGIFGPNAVITASWARRPNAGHFQMGPDDPIYYQSFTNAQSNYAILASGRGSAGSTEYLTSGTSSYWTVRDVENWSLDINYIWGAHNIDTGIQRINERNERRGVGLYDRTFTLPAMRYDGTYLVWNPFAADSPLHENPGADALASYNYADAQSWRRGVIGSDRVPWARLYSAGLNGYKPYDAQTTSVYLNDNWTFNDNFSVSAGIRLDQSLVTQQPTPNVPDGELVNSITLNPRLRLQYDLFGDNRHVFNLIFTQAAGSLYKAAMGDFAASNGTAVNRKYIWNQGSGQPRFVSKEELKNLKNFGHYYAYTDSIQYFKVDPDLKPEQTTNFEFMYRRAFDDGGHFRVSLIYNLLNRALYAEYRDEEMEMKDPTGTIPDAGAPFMQASNTYQYIRYLYNRADRGRHYASAEMECMIPLVSKPTWRLNWGGNWTIAKTTGNFVFDAVSSDGRSSTESNSIRYVDQLVAIGMPREMVDPWGETTATGRHRVRSWVTFSHGERGGIISDLTLFANWDDATYSSYSWSYKLPNTTFLVDATNPNVPTGNRGHIQNMSGSSGLDGVLYPYGFAHRMNNGHMYYADFSWNVTIPLKGTLSVFFNFMIGNVFNGILDSQGRTEWTNTINNGGVRNWRRPTDNESDYSPQKVDSLWGLQIAPYNTGRLWGTYTGDGGARQFNSKLEFGFRF